jgi:methyltransferase (TIGR00027 family)
MDSLGATALGIAYARAQESRRPDRLFEDPYAQRFVTAGAESSPWADTMTGGGRSREAAGVWTFLIHHVAVRTRFFDDYFAAAGAEGCRQAVLVAAGLDARGLRLNWPPGIRVFELDQGPVLAFKDRVLAGAAPPAGVERVPVAVDLRDEWGGALVAAGFDPSRTSTWLIEGLFPALTHEQSDVLLSRVSALAAPGSRIAYDDTGEVSSMHPMLDHLDPLLVELYKGGPTGDPVAWLSSHGWDGEVLDQDAVAERYGRRLDAEFEPSGRPHPRLVRGRRR